MPKKSKLQFPKTKRTANVYNSRLKDLMKGSKKSNRGHRANIYKK